MKVFRKLLLWSIIKGIRGFELVNLRGSKYLIKKLLKSLKNIQLPSSQLIAIQTHHLNYTLPQHLFKLPTHLYGTFQ